MAATGQIEGLAAILQRLHALENAVKQHLARASPNDYFHVLIGGMATASPSSSNTTIVSIGSRSSSGTVTVSVVASIVT